MKKNTSIKRKIILTIGFLAVAVPSGLVGLLALIYYYFGIEEIFSEKITESFNDTVHIAERYRDEHNNNIQTSALLAAGRIAPNIYEYWNNKPAFNIFLDKIAKSLELSEILVFTRDRVKIGEYNVLGKTSLSYSVMFEEISPEIISKADEGLVMVRTIHPDKVQALLRVDLFMGSFFMGEIYLLAARHVDSKILEHIAKTQAHADVFVNMKNEIGNIRYKVISAFLIMSLLFFIISIIAAERLAFFILKPISDLSKAISSFKLGKRIIKLQEKTSDGEINILAKSFNVMVRTITAQHNDIIYIQKLIEERNTFIEAIMGELSAGVLVLNRDLCIEMSNLAASKILQIGNSDISDMHYTRIIPEITQVVKKIIHLNNTNGSEGIISANINILRGGKKFNLLIKIQLLRTYSMHPLSSDTPLVTYMNDKIIITIDDITAVVSGQRFKAWADIARRLAHEIKNPLTPIQLAVDRLEKKFIDQIKEDAALFQKYIATIGTRVDEIKKMLTDFVEFAGISAPKLAPYKIADIVNEVLFLQKHLYPKIDYQFDNKLDGCYVLCDKMHITQILTNLLKNSAESIDSLRSSNQLQSKKDPLAGKIEISIDKSETGESVMIKVKDNGAGISDTIIERICEPYITTKTSGAGLGLSIVQKMIEEHKGVFSIKNLSSGGAIATFNLKIAKQLNKN